MPQASQRLVTGPPGFVSPGGHCLIAWPYSEADDPCYDLCAAVTSLGVIAAAATIMTYVIPETGIYCVEWQVAMAAPPAGGCVIACNVFRNAVDREIVSFMSTSEFGSADRCTCALRLRKGNILEMLLQGPATGVGSRTATLIATKRISR